MKPKIAIIGKGNVGSALQRGLDHAGYETRAVTEPADVREAVAWGDAVVLAVPFTAIDDVIGEIGDGVAGKTVVDVTNAVSAEYDLAVGCTTSGAEELQRKIPSAKVVKALNTVFAKHMDSGHLDGTPLTMFVAGDDTGAKDMTLAMGRDIGFDAVDAGPLKNARWLETLGYFNIQLGYTLEMGTDIGFKLIR